MAEKGLVYCVIAIAILLALSALGDALHKTLEQADCAMAGTKTCILEDTNTGM